MKLRWRYTQFFSQNPHHRAQAGAPKPAQQSVWRFQYGYELVCSVLSIGVFATAAKWAIAPPQRTYAPIQFPHTLAIGRDYAIGQGPLRDRAPEQSRYDRVLSGYAYELTHDGTAVRLEVRDLFTTTGDINAVLKIQTSIDSQSLPFTDGLSAAGSYRQFTVHQRAYLTSCIDDQGRSTVTAEQFRHNRYTYDWRGDRLWRWALGHTSIFQLRCFWVLLSTPSDPAHPDASQAALHQIWSVISHPAPMVYTQVVRRFNLSVAAPQIPHSAER